MVNLVFIYIIVSVILFYYALKYSIRDGLLEIETNKDDLIYYKKSENLLEEIWKVYTEVPKVKSKDAKCIYNDALDILFSEKKSKLIFEELTRKKNEILELNLRE